MPGASYDSWPRCSDSCSGVQLSHQGRCFAHSGKQERATALERLSAGAPLDFVRGVPLTADLLTDILDAAPREEHRIVLRDASFQDAVLEGADFRRVTFQGETVFARARFQGDTWFSRVSFQGDAIFIETSFQANAIFSRTNFQGDAGFAGANFQGNARFAGANFQGNARFGGVRFQSNARFAGANFQGNAVFGGASFQGDAWFAEVRFQADAGFVGASFQSNAVFTRGSFQGDADFRQATFEGNAWFAEAIFKTNARLTRASFQKPLRTGPVLVMQTLLLNRIAFSGPVQLAIAARRMSCVGCSFSSGGHLRVASAEFTLEEAEIPEPFIISSDPLPGDTACRWEELVGPPDATRRPSLVSVQRADVAGLVLSGIDLRKSHFADAHHLDQLKITGTDTFHRTGPRGTGRQVLAEECTWRRRRRPRQRRWQRTAELSDSPFLEDARQPNPIELAGLYRQLRKGREDAKNEPGAADFYYGEMEMRRAAARQLSVDRLLLNMYWLTAGYAQRASRALVNLVVLVGIVTVLLALWGLPVPVISASGTATITGKPPAQAVTFSLPTAASPKMPTSSLASRLGDPKRLELAVRNAVSTVVFRDPGQQLTTPGRYIEMAARFLGVVLLALTLLSVRNRVKR